jgi:hypothetical protein
VAARLAAVYGGAARLEVASPPGQFRVTLDLPLKGEMDVQPV